MFAWFIQVVLHKTLISVIAFIENNNKQSTFYIYIKHILFGLYPMTKLQIAWLSLTAVIDIATKIKHWAKISIKSFFFVWITQILSTHHLILFSLRNNYNLLMAKSRDVQKEQISHTFLFSSSVIYLENLSLQFDIYFFSALLSCWKITIWKKNGYHRTLSNLSTDLSTAKCSE